LSPPAPTHLLVSTHFDDAALSLAHVLQQAGALATVVTVCGGEPPEGIPVSDWDACSGFATGVDAARTRLLEDAAACAVTGARAHPLSHCDSPYAPLPAPAVLRAQIAPLLRGDCMLWLPAGFINPDHAHLRAALLPLAAIRPPGRVGTYIDLPYAASAELPDADEVRLTDAAFELKLAAVRCHASQLPLLQKTWPDLLERHGPLSRERTV
jgi:LmbE family N-acetylglucosaminyl deacetylase